MLGRVMQDLPDKQLQRLADANGLWIAASYGVRYAEGVKRCFVGHILDGCPLSRQATSNWEDQFDRLCGRIPKRLAKATSGYQAKSTVFHSHRLEEAVRIGRMIEQRARRILADRKIKAMEQVETRQLVEV